MPLGRHLWPHKDVYLRLLWCFTSLKDTKNEAIVIEPEKIQINLPFSIHYLWLESRCISLTVIVEFFFLLVSLCF